MEKLWKCECGGTNRMEMVTHNYKEISLDDYGNLCCEDIEDGINHEWRPVMICKDCGEEHALTEEEKTAVVKQIDDSSDMDFFRMSRFGKWE